MKWKRDWGLTSRVILTMFLLFVVYLVFIASTSGAGYLNVIYDPYRSGHGIYPVLLLR